MTRNVRIVLPALVALATTSSVLADPPVSATIAAPSSQPTAATATTVSAATVKGATGDDKTICKTEAPIGSRLGGHKVCMKKSEWDAQSADARRARDFAPPAGIGGAH